MKRVKRFLLSAAQIILTLACFVGIALAVYQIWQSIQSQTYGMLWGYVLLFIICAYVLGLVVDRGHIVNIADADDGVLLVLAIATIILGGFVYFTINAGIKRIYWLFNPDKRPPPKPKKEPKEKGRILHFIKRDS